VTRRGRRGCRLAAEVDAALGQASGEDVGAGAAGAAAEEAAEAALLSAAFGRALRAEAARADGCAGAAAGAGSYPEAGADPSPEVGAGVRAFLDRAVTNANWALGELRVAAKEALGADERARAAGAAQGGAQSFNRFLAGERDAVGKRQRCARPFSILSYLLILPSPPPPLVPLLQPRALIGLRVRRPAPSRSSRPARLLVPLSAGLRSLVFERRCTKLLNLAAALLSVLEAAVVALCAGDTLDGPAAEVSGPPQDRDAQRNFLAQPDAEARLPPTAPPTAPFPPPARAPRRDDDS
jgi:hypothetical protein